MNKKQENNDMFCSVVAIDENKVRSVTIYLVCDLSLYIHIATNNTATTP
jgi:hypothetical protein